MTPRQLKLEQLAKRLDKVKDKFPAGIWVDIFVKQYPQYKKQRTYLTTVMLGRSLDSDVIECLEEIAPRMKKLTVEHLFTTKKNKHVTAKNHN